MDRNIILKIVDDELRSTNEVATELNITKQGVSKLVARGELSPVKVMPNSFLFLESDVNKIKIKKKLINSINPQPIYGGTTRKFKKDFFDLVRIDDVIGIYIYFYESEAAMDGFYTTNEIAKRDTLLRINIPYFIVKYSDLSEIYFEGAICGYGGEGPHGSYDILVDTMGVPTHLANYLFSARTIKYFREGNQWRCTYVKRNIETKDDGYEYYQEPHYIYNNNFVELINTTKKGLELCYGDNKEDNNLVDTYKWFIPAPETITIYPESIAIETGHFLLSSTYQEIYPVVVRDHSGNELWLNLNVKENEFLCQQERIMDVINAFGFNIKDNDKNQDSNTVIKHILDLIMKVDRPITFSRHLRIN